MNRPDFLHALRNLVETQRTKGYKPAWVWHQVSSTFAPFSESELQYIATTLGYKSGWVWHQLKSQQQTQQVSQPLSQLQESLNLLKLDIPFTLEELKRSYRTKALQLHPDQGGSHESFVALNEAYKYLINYLHVEGVA
ncbi:putative DnaJ domain-containing protein [Tolypothrix sp. NIES-4075]|uniref:J domain-containing protein n=1 Tax=Tolypothrix sp. NIES-4075 TaxID=2005459 RepID=UPI000B5CDC2F|nr:J domain-containing protein [Tolypothrix sp. NIES-4075]GAX45711.1 putative DnaJ domain-containing protein [Tolypothrix sp. NIES-4075]